jgi:acyl-CoA hydrolase
MVWQIFKLFPTSQADATDIESSRRFEILLLNFILHSSIFHRKYFHIVEPSQTRSYDRKGMPSPPSSSTSPNHHRIGKRPAESKAEVVYKIFPNDLNSEGTVFGGVILSLMDRTALVVAERHSGKSCVTVSIDAVRFLAPGRKGDNLICTAVITRSWTSSMEIDLKIIAEHPFSGETKEILEAFFTFCAFDQWGKPTKIPVPVVIPVTEEEHHRYEEAGIRMEERLAATKGRKERKASFLANGRKKLANIQSKL